MDAGPSERIIFITSVLYDGNLGGLAGADAKCQTLATAAKLPGTYKAWLSDSQWNASARLTHSFVPYVLVDKTVVASDWFALTSGVLQHAVNLTETNQPPPAGTYTCGNEPAVWSNTGTSGISKMGGNCTDWTSSTATTTHVGSYDYKSWAWTDFCQLGGAGICAKTAGLYCLQQ